MFILVSLIVALYSAPLLVRLLLVSTVLVVLFYKYRAGYWKRRGVSGPKSRIFTGHIPEIYDGSRHMATRLRDWTQEYGSVYGIQQGFKNILVTSDLQMIEELFVKKFDCFYGRKLNTLAPHPEKDDTVNTFSARGIRWKRLRNLTSPSFSTQSLKATFPVVADSIESFVGRLESRAGTGEEFNIHPIFQQLTLDVILRIAFGQKESEIGEHEDVLKAAKAVFARDGVTGIAKLGDVVPALRPVIRGGLKLSSSFTNLPINFLVRHLEAIVNQRKEDRASGAHDPKTEMDFIDTFLDAETNEEIGDRFGDLEQMPKVQKKLHAGEIVSQCVLFLLAGYDTTANTLAFAAHSLALNPDVQKKVQEEIDDVCPDSEVSYGQLNRLRYLDAVCKESLRMYPIAANASARLCMRDTTLGEVKIKKGEYVQADILSVHFSKEIWGEDAEEFNPARWEDEMKRSNLAWLPFGAGPRICAGQRLALMEEKLALVHLMKRFSLRRTLNTQASGRGCRKRLHISGKARTRRHFRSSTEGSTCEAGA
ncbi:hypothetical protein L596_019044 [Steinernema carpocapsae]|uniref:Cytochrome P450 n=1 Tax=Steinernema carpocapsae TaxID=34508 RepID=A0A4U5N6X9_STECR|nr:hypothetical protein L596_019044 [Steinernema carpocapsae]